MIFLLSFTEVLLLRIRKHALQLLKINLCI